jgi:hypothetical protein
MIYTEVTKYNFVNTLRRDDYASWSYEGAEALYDYFEQLSEDTDQNIEFDPVAIRCEFTEYEDLDEIKETYDCIKRLEDLHDYTQVIEFDGGIIIADF